VFSTHSFQCVGDLHQQPIIDLNMIRQRRWIAKTAQLEAALNRTQVKLLGLCAICGSQIGEQSRPSTTHLPITARSNAATAIPERPIPDNSSEHV